MKYTVRDVMQTNLQTVGEQTTISEAIELLMEYRISGLPVVDKELSLVGIVTEKDLLRVCHEEPGTLNQVGDLMTRKVRSFQVEDSLEVLCDCLMANHFRRVPVLEGEKLVGLVSRADLMPTILEVLMEVGG